MPSDILSASRRVPRQARSEQRVAAILEAAEEVIAARGYEAATLTAVAQRVGASIGSLYQYFPDKAAVANALADRYGAQIAERWEIGMADADTLEPGLLVDRLLALTLGFLADCPAYLSLTTAASGYRHNPADRDRLRSSVSMLYQRRNAALAGEDGDRAAEVTVQIVKALNATLAASPPQAWDAVKSDFQMLLSGYIREKGL